MVHMRAGAADAIEIISLLRIELAAAQFAKRAAKAIDRAQWPTQVVGDRIAESLELLIDARQLARPLAHAPLELRVKRQGLPLRSFPLQRIPRATRQQRPRNLTLGHIILGPRLNGAQ